MKKILSILLVGILSIGLIACEGSKKEESKRDEIKTVELGEKADSGHWNIKVLDVKEVSEVKGRDETIKTDDKFILINLELTNIAKSGKWFDTAEFKLEDLKSGKVYSMDNKGHDAGRESIVEEKFYNKNDKYITIVDEVNPDSTKFTCIGFEVSKDLDLNNLILGNNNRDSKEVVAFKLK